MKIIALLRGPTSWNATRLAEHFGTSRRNVYRDMAVLELAGIPFTYDPDFGEGGGYRIRPEWWFPSVGLTEQECVDLAVMTRVAETGGIPLLSEMSEVRDKLLGTLPSKQQDLIRSASELFDVLGIGMDDHSHCRRVMLTLQHAVLKRRQLRGTYCSPHQGRAVEISIQPRRVFLCRTAWYLAAFDNEASQTRLYRVARFRTLEETTEAQTITPHFSLRDFLGNAWTVYRGDRDYHVEVLFDGHAAPLVAEQQLHHTQEMEHHEDGSLTFRVTVSGLEEIKYWILHWGPRATVVKPPELVAEMRSLAENLLDKYRPAPRSR